MNTTAQAELSAHIQTATVSDRLALLEILLNSLIEIDAVADVPVTGPRGQWGQRLAYDDLATITCETIPQIRAELDSAEERAGAAFRHRFIAQHTQRLSDVV